MPLNIDFTQVLLHMLNFVILVGALGLLLYKPVNKFMTDRAAHYEALKKENEETAAANEKLKAEYDEKLASAKAEIAEMRANAEKRQPTAPPHTWRRPNKRLRLFWLPPKKMRKSAEKAYSIPHKRK